MFEFLTKKQRLAKLSSALKIHITLEAGKEIRRGSFELSAVNPDKGKQTSQIRQHLPSSSKGVRSSSAGKKRAISKN
ncbi:hypothetical protein KP509_10G008400 [Ceratopteris richardii]|uniref:Uncharacterized protein n=1 Tax=Ceratopteris richardii TaxID=49495 RepID=A0A8T2TW22_CERRI|nr:hypothetical protein KP509_10G008400 [Ceratopteris richardii]